MSLTPDPSEMDVSDVSPVPVLSVDVGSVVAKLTDAVERTGLTSNFGELSNFVSTSKLSLQQTGEAPLQIHNSKSMWKQHDSVMSFLLNGQLHARVHKTKCNAGTSSVFIHTVAQDCESHVKEISERSCSQVREAIMIRCSVSTHTSTWCHHEKVKYGLLINEHQYCMHHVTTAFDSAYHIPISINSVAKGHLALNVFYLQLKADGTLYKSKHAFTCQTPL